MAHEKLPPATAEQITAWSFYGSPNNNRPSGKGAATAAGSDSTSQPKRSQVGEVRYIVGWMADQMVRMGWRVQIGGKSDWTIRLPDGRTVTSKSDQTNQDADDHPMLASAHLLESIMWNARTVREVTTNLFVAGELHYMLDADVWRVVSVIRGDRDEIAARSSIKVRGLWPHPADPEAADAPLFGVLSTLEDMWWLNRLSRAQSANRVATRGIVLASDQLSTQNGATGDGFWADFETMLARPMENPDDVAPVGLIGPASVVEPVQGGAKGLAYIVPKLPYDDKVDERMKSLVERLAYGLPIPPEILLGLQAQSKATAFQVEGSTYRAHIEPVALLIADIATDALSQHLPDAGGVKVIPDSTVILARRHSVADVVQAYRDGVAGEDYYREVLGIPDRGVPSDEERERRAAERAPRSAVVDDPANVAARETAITAAASQQSPGDRGEPGPDPDPDELATVLERIDMALLHELRGAAGQCVLRARSFVGAKLRSSEKIRKMLPQGTSNQDVMAELGPEACLEALGAEGEAGIRSVLGTMLEWWESRAAVAQGDALRALESAGVDRAEFAINGIERSVALLEQATMAAIVGGRDVTPAEVSAVIEAAGK